MTVTFAPWTQAAMQSDLRGSAARGHRRDGWKDLGNLDREVAGVGRS
jgi:hypothetical protein